MQKRYRRRLMIHYEKNLSLIYPEHATVSNHLFVSKEDCKTLLGNFLYNREFDISDFMTDDIDTIVYRQEIFSDMLAEPEITKLIEEILPMLENIEELYRLRENSHKTEGQMYSIKLIEIYITFINTVYLKTNEFKSRIKSRAFLNFAQTVSEIALCDEFRSLVKNTKKLSKEISEVKSITVGLNLDPTFTPCEFGVLSLNNEYVVSNNFMDKLIKKDDDNKLVALCPLKITSKTFTKEEKRFADMAISSTINKLLKSVIQDWEPAIKAFYRQNTKMFLPLIAEFKYLLFGAKTLGELKDKKLPLSMPVIKPKEQKAFCVKSIYHPVLALQKNDITYNDIEFDENGMIYIITGPNSGGKTVFISSIGICQIFAQLGFLVPGKYAEISPVDRIFVSFANKLNSMNKGRLEEECVQMKEIFNKISEYSLILMDETFSSTSSFEGAHIACDVISGFSAYACRAVFSTHMHELVSMIGGINSNEATLSKVDTLTVGIGNEGDRTYEIIRAIPDGKSYARSISDKYGLTYEMIVSQLKHKQ